MQLVNVLMLIIAAVFAVTIHEYVKAKVSAVLGDPLPKARGRLTLNPAKHIDPLGLICIVVTGYGWGKPTETAPIYYKDRKKGTILTYITPSVVNLLIGTALAMVYKMAYNFYMPSILLGSADGIMSTSIMALLGLLSAMAQVNVSLALFNIIPVYPLDGAKILSLMLSPNAQVKISAYEKILQLTLIFVLLTGGVKMVLAPLANVFLR